MKRIILFLFVIVNNLNLTLGQTNYALYTLDDIFPACISDNAIYGVKWENNKRVIKVFELSNGKELKSYNEGLPENPIEIIFAHYSKSILYFVTSRKVDDTGVKYTDAIYELNTKNGKITELRKVHYNYLIPNKMGVVGNLLVFTTIRNPTYVFDLKKKQVRNLNPNIHYQLLSIAPEHNGFLMLNVNKLYNGNISVHFMDVDNNMSDVVGYITSKLTIKTDNRSIQLPTITLVDSTYSWIGESIKYNTLPIYNFEVAMRPFWLRQVVLLDKAYKLKGIVDADKSYLIAKANTKLYVYDYKSPNNEGSSSLSDVDIKQIEEYLSNSTNYEQSVISSEIINEVFDGVFYEVYKKNKLEHIAVQAYGNYFEVKDYSLLLDLLQPDFRLNSEEQVQKFNAALNILFPVNDLTDL